MAIQFDLFEHLHIILVPERGYQAVQESKRTVLADLTPFLLETGATGRLLAGGEIEVVLPLDDAVLLHAATPVVGGKMKPDPTKIARRRAYMVKAVLDRGPFGLIVLGSSHDLSPMIRMHPGCEYIRVWLGHFPM